MQGYEWFVNAFCKATGIDLEQYKRPQMERRLTSLRDKRGYHRFEDFLQDALANPVMMAEILDRMTINVSEFFRNRPRWESLVQNVIPIVTRNHRLKVWSAACSTGEEPYTLLMMLYGILPLPNVDVLATDIDEEALRAAKAATYARDALGTVTPDEQRRFFAAVNDRKVQVVEDVRSRVTFRKHNLLSDAYGTDFDLILCRNVLIYFTDAAKEAMYHKFAAALRSGGVLFVGSTEQIFRPETFGFRQILPFFYQKL